MAAPRPAESTASQNATRNRQVERTQRRAKLASLLRDAVWDVAQVRTIRLPLTQQQIGQRPISLCIDETGDVKKGGSTDYAARQYIGNLGKTAPGAVSVNADAVVDDITYPLLFRLYKPRSRLKAEDDYQSKPEIAVELIREIQALGFVIARVLVDSLYGESGTFIGVLQELKLPYIVAIRSIELRSAKGVHAVLMPKSVECLPPGESPWGAIQAAGSGRCFNTTSALAV